VARLTAGGHHVRPLVRRPAKPEELTWNPVTGKIDSAKLEAVDGVIHLAGENIGARWTRARKARIRESRIRGTRLLSETLARLAHPPSFLISASAVGIYGDRGDQILTESSPPGDSSRDFLVSVCQEWEGAADPARAGGIRVIHPRFGVVLSPDGGALRKLLLFFRLGLGGPVGSGDHWMSWVALQDVAEVVAYMASDTTLEGPVNVTAPEPVTNRDFTRTLGRVLRRPAVLPVPAAALRVVFGEMADRAILSSARVLPARLDEAGYRFAHPALEAALRSMLSPGQGSSFPV
ncbi:MAG TPA: TIGR01777 family oxidoreductase, partial [Gemmatimonadales bacterium]